MDIRHLRQIAAIHRHGSFGRAAEELGVSQPALSRSIARLEDELRMVLFDRSGAGARVTPMGSLLVERGERIIGEAQRLARDVELVARGDLGVARIGVGAAFRGEFLSRFAVEVARRYPNLRLNLTVDTREVLVRRLKEGHADLIFATNAVDIEESDCISTEILREPIQAYASPSHPLATAGRITVDDLSRYPGCSPPTSTLYGRAELFGLSGEPASLASFFTCNDYEAMRRLAIAGLATWLAPAHVPRADIASGDLVRLDLDFDLEIAVVGVMTRASIHSPVHRSILEIGRRIGASLATG